MRTFEIFCFLILLNEILCEICQDDICEYEFSIHHARTMTYYKDGKAYVIQLNGTDLEIADTSFRRKADQPDLVGKIVSADDVITADGYRRDIIVINGQLPGPTIEVMKGAQVVVRVTNNLIAESVSIHWHGMHQFRTPFMDGTSHITQCPITPGQTFTYRFKADPVGTHWYHPHLGYQRMDGATGMFIVHPQMPQVKSFNVAVTDWFKEPISTFGQLNMYGVSGERRGSGGVDVFRSYSSRHFSQDMVELTSVTYQSALINGRGRSEGMETLPLETFNVDAGEKCRFRMVSTAAEFSFEISVDNHKLTVVALDGQEIQPISNLDYIIIGPGERIDFELTADQPASTYWFIANNLNKYDSLDMKPADANGVKAILSYSSDASMGDPVDRAKTCSNQQPCRTFGCPWKQYPDGSDKTCIEMNDVKSTSPLPDDLKTAETDRETFLNFEYVIGSSINGRKFKSPQVPLLGLEDKTQISACTEGGCENGCVCTNILDIPLGQTVQLVITNINPASTGNSHHYVHIHGYQVYITKVGFAPYNETTGLIKPHEHNSDIKCDNGICSSLHWETKPTDLNLENPPLRDTFVIPAGGYVVARFKTFNPGYWLFHCHQVTHHAEGMSMVLNIGKDEHPPLPENFPKCHEFEFDSAEYDKYIAGEWDDKSDQDGEDETEDKDLKDNTVGLTKEQLAGICIAVLFGGILLGIIPTAMCLTWGRHKSMTM